MAPSHDFCAFCGGDGWVHEKSCDFLKPVPETGKCSCEQPPCPRCHGKNSLAERSLEIRDVLALSAKASDLIQKPLSNEDREYIFDFIQRIGRGYAPRYDDHFRLEEAIRKYSHLPSTPPAAEPTPLPPTQPEGRKARNRRAEEEDLISTKRIYTPPMPMSVPTPLTPTVQSRYKRDRNGGHND